MLTNRVLLVLAGSGVLVLLWWWARARTEMFTPNGIRFLRLSIADAGVLSPPRGELIGTLLAGPSSRTCRPRRTSSLSAQPGSLSSRLAVAEAGSAKGPAANGSHHQQPPGAGAYLAPSDHHAVHLYDTDDEIVSSVATFFEAAITGGEAIVLVATPEHRRAIEEELGERRYPLDGRSYLALDAQATLDSLLVDGEPNRDRFRSVVGGAVGELVPTFPGVTIYGEMVGLLWERGQMVSAMCLEDFWNELGAELPFSLLCGYRVDADDRSAFEGVCGIHSHVVAPREHSRST
jgi:hypothetical protein